MHSINLISSSGSILTRTDYVPDPNNPGHTIPVSYPCDIDGKKITITNGELPIYLDQLSGETYVRIAEVIPSGNDSVSKDLAQAILSHDPFHYSSPDGDIRGYFVLAPDFNHRWGAPETNTETHTAPTA